MLSSVILLLLLPSVDSQVANMGRTRCEECAASQYYAPASAGVLSCRDCPSHLEVNRDKTGCQCKDDTYNASARTITYSPLPPPAPPSFLPLLLVASRSVWSCAGPKYHSEVSLRSITPPPLLLAAAASTTSIRACRASG